MTDKELDQKLRVIVRDLVSDGPYETDLVEQAYAVKDIKAAFKDAGYVQLIAECPHTELADSICTLGHDRKICTSCGKDFHMNITERDEHNKVTVYTPPKLGFKPVEPGTFAEMMTGPEWFAKFNKRVAHIKFEPTEEVAVAISKMVQAARKAAGMEEQ